MTTTIDLRHVPTRMRVAWALMIRREIRRALDDKALKVALSQYLASPPRRIDRLIFQALLGAALLKDSVRSDCGLYLASRHPDRTESLTKPEVAKFATPAQVVDRTIRQAKLLCDFGHFSEYFPAHLQTCSAKWPRQPVATRLR